MNEVNEIVGLYRLSKESKTKDGKVIQKGLSIEAQEAYVHGYADQKKGKIVMEFVENISGRKKQRPLLQEALDYCRIHKCTLVIASLDRLSRRAALICALLESKINFRVVQYGDIDPKEMPHFFQMLAISYEFEVRNIRRRTKDALQAKKAKGEELGAHGKYVLSKKNKEQSYLFAQSLYPLIEKLRQRGIHSIRKIAKELNRKKVPTFRNEGQKWHASTVARVLNRMNGMIPSSI